MSPDNCITDKQKNIKLWILLEQGSAVFDYDNADKPACTNTKPTAFPSALDTELCLGDPELAGRIESGRLLAELNVFSMT